VDQVAGLHVAGVSSAREAVEGAQVIVTPGAYRGREEPVIEAGWMQPGSFGCAVGLFSRWEPEALRAADKLCTDDTPQLQYYAAEGYFHDLPPVYADLGEILAGKQTGRESRNETIISMNLGAAVADIAIAAKVYQNALQRGLGHDLPL
jgi:ornithine cyclodeaminase/alanine dehydrogenase-like protein (mu-crystallin family)